MSSQSSQNKLQKLLDNFVTSEKSVLIFIADSADVKLKMINHLRIMIEMVETRSKRASKLFVLLLHFPAVDFYNDCYSSLYLDGWEHHYLDTITHGTVTRDSKDIRTIVDIQQWYRCCCATPDAQIIETVVDEDYVYVHIADDHSKEMDIDALIEDSLPIIASRVSLCTEKDLRKLLTHHGFGLILATKYMKYWDTKAKVMELSRLTEHTCRLKSTLNVTDSLQINIRSYFINFAVYMVNLISDDLKATLAFPDHYLVAVCHKLLEVMPVPRLAQLRDFNIMNHRLHLKMPKTSTPLTEMISFPLSKHISKYVEDLIDECRENVNRDHVGSSQAKQSVHTQYCKAVRGKIDSGPNEVSIVIKVVIVYA